jgi:hypothetical protein
MAINEELVFEYQVAKAALEVAKERFDKVENELCQEMLVSQTKSDLVCVRGDDYKVTVVAGETVRVDEKGLEKYLGKRVFKRLCTYKVDKKLLEAAIKDPAMPLSPESLSAFISITPNKPYVRVTKDTGDPE